MASISTASTYLASLETQSRPRICSYQSQKIVLSKLYSLESRYLTLTRTYHHLKQKVPLRERKSLSICFVLAEKNEDQIAKEKGDRGENANLRVTERMMRKRLERNTYLVAAIMSSCGITSMAILVVYYRFSLQMEVGKIPYMEMLGTFSLSIGAVVAMEYWARWAHKALWHDSLWPMHESHHQPRNGPFELNDVFAIVNAIPAVALLSYGVYHKSFVSGLCFGAGLGITIFGMAYMFVHDGLIHRRFPVGPIADVPYLQKVASAHQLHHSNKFKGVPYGLFLGPKELEEVGGKEALDMEIKRRMKLLRKS